MSALALASYWLVFSGVAAAQTAYTVVPDRTESLHLSYRAFGPFVQQFVYTQENDALQTVVLWSVSDDEEDYFAEAHIVRNFLEFTVPRAVGDATLVLEKYYDSHNTDPERRILVAIYTPDADLTTEDFDREVTEIGTFVTNPSVNTETILFDLTPVLWRYAGQRLGIRLSVLDEGPPDEHPSLFAGAAFRDAYLGAEPTIEIVEFDGTMDVCHVQGRSGTRRTLAVDANSLGAHIGHGDTLGACP